jgi:uncharacterized protein (DUF433 family)
MPNPKKLYSGKDPREIPLYTLAEAARHLHLPSATLRTWVVGRAYRLLQGEERRSLPLIDRPDSRDERLSFNNLVEAHVLRALRVEQRVPMGHVRRALDYAQREFGIDRLLISGELLAAPGEMFLKEYGRLLSLSRSGQFAMEKILEAFLSRVARDAEGRPLRLHPFIVPNAYEDRRVVSIDPRVAYGRPHVADRGISTAILAERLNAGESIAELAYDYRLDEKDIAQAILYESFEYRRAA